MKIIAHRGAGFAAPENTMPAFISAIEHGANAVEIDIRLTKDKKVVVAHDLGFSRVMCGEKAKEARNICDMTLEEVCKVKLPYAGHLQEFFPEDGYEDETHYYIPWCLDDKETIFSLYNRLLKEAEVFASHDEKSDFIFSQYEKIYGEKYAELLKEDNRKASYSPLEEFLIWLKSESKCEFAEIEFKDLGLIQEVDRLIRDFGVAGKCILFSGVVEINEEIQAFYKDNKKPLGLRLGANIRHVNERTLKMIEDWDLYEVGLNAYDFSDVETAILIEKGIEVFVNLGDTPKWWDKMKRLRVKGFKTNCIREYVSGI